MTEFPNNAKLRLAMGLAKKRSREKAFAQLKVFAAALGWRGLRQWKHTITDYPGSAEPLTVCWYESGVSHGDRQDFYLQLNECPIGETEVYAGFVYAMRYRICTGAHRFQLTRNTRDFAHELHKVQGWLHRDLFLTLPKRREVRALHPECCDYTWRKIREKGLPH